MNSISHLTARITAETGVPFEPSSPDLLLEFEGMGAPKALVDFFREYSPEQCVHGQVRLLPLSDVIVENRELLPGYCASPFGYWTFATTYCGDAYCVVAAEETDHCRVVLMPHGEVDETTPAEEFARLAKPIAESLEDFLDQFLRDALDEECDY